MFKGKNRTIVAVFVFIILGLILALSFLVLSYFGFFSFIDGFDKDEDEIPENKILYTVRINNDSRDTMMFRISIENTIENECWNLTVTLAPYTSEVHEEYVFRGDGLIWVEFNYLYLEGEYNAGEKMCGVNFFSEEYDTVNIFARNDRCGMYGYST